MNITDEIKEFWSHWIEISEEEYIQNKKDKENYTYIVDQDTNKISKYLKRDGEIKQMIYYAGIGSRETPTEILNLFESIGYYLAQNNFILRSGHAKGADQAFECGCDKANGKKEIYLPWKGFEDSNSNLIVQQGKAYEIAEKFHPYWHNLSEGAKKLQARNSHQILGKDLNTPCQFVVCWTKSGKGKGGTGQAIRIAKHYEIPIFDAGRYEDIKKIKLDLYKYLKENYINASN
mgnify:FL=1